MKLNLGCGDDIRAQDYLNIDIEAHESLASEVFRQGDVANLDWLCENGTVEEVLALNILPYLTQAQADPALVNWVAKLQTGGTLKFSAPDLWAIARDFYNDRRDLAGTVQMLYGTQERPHMYVQSGIDTRTLSRRLVALGMQITVKRYEQNTIYVEAVKQ